MAWTEQRIDLLKKLWIVGVSASDIAGQLGVEFTRNAVIGKVHRLGLTERQKTRTTPAPAKAARAPAPKPAKQKKRLNHAVLVWSGAIPLIRTPQPVPAEQPQPEIYDVPVEQRRTLLQLNESVCRWPFGQPCEEGFFFCGGDAIPNLSYCAYHARIAYRIVPTRSRPQREFSAAGKLAAAGAA